MATARKPAEATLAANDPNGPIGVPAEELRRDRGRWAIGGEGEATLPGEGPRMTIETNFGGIEIELFRAQAPATVKNFLEYVERGDYDGTIFHQVVEGYMLLGGGFGTDLIERPARAPISNEATNGLSNRRGTVAMAREPEQIDGATRQFFINVGDNPMLDHRATDPANYGYCVFGRVVRGMEVVDRIAESQVRDTTDFEMLPFEPVVIQRIKPSRQNEESPSPAGNDERLAEDDGLSDESAAARTARRKSARVAR